MIDVTVLSSLDGQALDLLAYIAPIDSAADPATAPAHWPDALRAEALRASVPKETAQTVVAHDGTAWLVGAAVGTGADDHYRQVGAAIQKAASAHKASALGLDCEAFTPSALTQIVEGLVLAGYTFDRYKASDVDKQPPLTLAIRVNNDDAPAFREAALRGARNAKAVTFARNLSNEPPGVCTPEWLAQQSRSLAEEHDFECTVLEEDELAARGFNLIVAVGKGSIEPPRLVHMVYRPDGEIRRRVALIGKGVTYDSGGYSMKPADYQVDMHLDMGGAAAVLGAAHAIGHAKPQGIEVHFIVPTVENLVSDRALKVMEIIRSYSGRTVEVLNTDAEGRLILADAIAYATEQEPDAMIDLATLTGACVAALGQETAGVWSNDTALRDAIVGAAERSAERVWPMPLAEPVKRQLKSDFADTKNIGSRWGGAISAALFLESFAQDTAWAHIDLAGPAMTDAAWSWVNKGGTGFGALLLAEWVQAQAS